MKRFRISLSGGIVTALLLAGTTVLGQAKEEARAKVEECRENHCTSLSLGMEELTSIPEEVLTLSSVTELRLGGSGISDISLLAKMPGLRELDLEDVCVSDFIPLATLLALTDLDLSGTPISDLSALSNMKVLNRLTLDDTQVLDLSPLSTLFGLRSLKLQRTAVADLIPVSELAGLNQPNIDETAVTNLFPIFYAEQAGAAFAG